MMNELNPKQPEFVLSTSNYTKKYLMQYNIAHFYQFKAESVKLGVIPDACVDILFAKKNSRLITRIAGTFLEKGEADTDLDTEYFGVRFMPGFNPVSDFIKLSELVNNEESFEDINAYDSLKEKMLEDMYFADSFEEKIKVFMLYHRKQYENLFEDKNSLKCYLKNEIINSGGSLKLSDLSISTGYSERYLNKNIHEDFGLNPKSLIRFIRFQKSISNLVQSIDHASGLDTALESGYYDQAHFIKEFKQYTGLTPMQYINNLLHNSYDKKLHVLF